MPDIGEGFVYYAVFLFSTTLHEAAHAWAAKIGGDLTAYHGGQVSLDPRPHIRRAPFGMVVLPIISVVLSGWPFGFASAPYSIDWARRYPRRAAWMALAGPGSNLTLVLLSGAVINIGLLLGWFHAPQSITFGHIVASNGGGIGDAVAFLLGVFFSLNLVLFILNMLPVPPLDGSGALPLLLPAETVPRYQHLIWTQPAISFIGILVAWQVFGRIFHPMFLFAASVLYPGVSYH
ncbi:MAG TPA: site-2 protease family protein [Gemmatimonadales bacterium]